MSSNKAARNEQRKLLATLMNTVAGATVTVGVLAPAAGLLYGLSVPVRSTFQIGIVVSAWLVTASVLHLTARRILRGIEEMIDLETYISYIAPLILLAFGLGMVGLTRLIERWERRNDHVDRPTR